MTFSKRLLLTLAILAFILIISVFIIETKKVARAQNQIKIFPVAYDIESTGNITWQNPQNAFNQDLSEEASSTDFNQENSAYIAEINKEESVIPPTTTTTTTNETTTTTVPLETTTTTNETTTTTIPEETTTTTTIPEETTSTTIPEETTTTTTTIPEETTTTTNETTTTTEPVSLIKKFFSLFLNKAQAEETILNSSSLIFSDFGLGYFDLDKNIIQNAQLRVSFAGLGQEGDKVSIDYFYNNEWQNLGEINLSQESSNNTNGGYFLFALPIFNNLDDFQNLKIKFTYDKPGIYLDAVWLEANYEALAEKKLPSKAKHDWKFDENPEFDFSESENNNSFWARLKNLIIKEKLDISIITPDGVESTDDIVFQGNKIKINKQSNSKFKPGRYTLIIKQGSEIITQEFTWGVLAINTNKSIYLPNETAYLQMAALNDHGHTLCDASLKLEILNPKSEKKIFTTQNGKIKYSGSCGPDNVTDTPDYFAYYKVDEPGIYQMILTNLDSGYSIEDSFEVKESVPFEIERIGPTRIYPLAQYQMKIKVKANQDFTGQIKEQVPSDFVISAPTSLNVDLKTGESIELNYTFDAPDISPYIYLLGPLQIGDFYEARQWQIASDSPKVFKMQTGYFMGNGTSLSITGLGFKPELVIIKPDTKAGTGALFKSTVMPYNDAAYFIGTTDLTTSPIRLDEDGFTVITNNANTVNVGHSWIAFAGSDCSPTGMFCLGTYYGTGSGTSSISTGFQPDLVIVKQAASANAGNWRSSAMPDNYAQFFATTTQDTTGAYFTTLDASGFTVGATNNAAATYYYIAFKNTTNKVKVGTYSGSSSAQNITGVGFQPDFVFVKNADAETAVGAVYSINESYGNQSYYFTDTARVVGAITDLISDGFSVGTNSTANGSGNTLYYAAFGSAETHTATGTFQMANGTYTGTGAYLNINGLGFAPDLVIIKGDTTQAGVFKTRLMPANYTAYLDAATANFAGGIISLNQDGFTLDSNATVNSSGLTYYWTAYGNAWNPHTHSGAADFVIGAYYGNGIDNRNITRLPFQPDLVVIKANAAYAGVWRSSAQAGDLSGFFAATAETSNYIQALNSDGFQVGTGSRSVNYAGYYYFYFAFKSGSNFAVGTYSGSGTSQDITSVGFQPDHLWIKKTTATRGVLRTSSLSGDGALPFINVAKILNAITQFISNGFTVDSADETNTSGTNNYRYVAWKNPVTFTQCSYRFFENLDSTDVGTPLADQNTSITLSTPNQAFRLRLVISVDTSTLSQELGNFKLQFATKTGDVCGDDETFADISTSTAIAFNDNSSPNDGDALTNNSNDPSCNSRTILNQTYEEANNFNNYQSVIYNGQAGKWDFALKDNSAPSNTTYCLKVIKANGDSLSSYSVYPEVSIPVPANTAPVVSNVKLNNQNNIDLNENSTTTISATADLYDAQGCSDITSVTAKIYRSGVTNGKDCTPNENNCYSVASCSITNCSGNYASTTCSIDMWFNADPTDSNTPWVSEYWRAYIEATDNGSLTGNNYSPADVPDVNSLLALSVDGSINYGSLNPLGKTDPLTATTTVSATGNISLDVNLIGTNLCTDYPTCASYYIPVGKQVYATSSVSYSSGTPLATDPGGELELDCPKTTDHTSPQTKDVYWGIEIPKPQKAGTYSGQNTFTAVKNELPWP